MYNLVQTDRQSFRPFSRFGDGKSFRVYFLPAGAPPPPASETAPTPTAEPTESGHSALTQRPPELEEATPLLRARGQQATAATATLPQRTHKQQQAATASQAVK